MTLVNRTFCGTASNVPLSAAEYCRQRREGLKGFEHTVGLVWNKDHIQIKSGCIYNGLEITKFPHS